MSNKYLNAANKAKEDEFYTQLTDIANELSHYTQHFKGKTVLCNCDDPYESNFFKYFLLNFNRLGLKRLTSTCWNGQGGVSVTGTSKGTKRKTAFKAIVEKVEDGVEDVERFLEEHKPTILKGNGDFRSEECIEILKEADIVVTNPPFSLFREYVAQLVKYNKKFLIIGNQNAITYKEIFPLIQEKMLWLGVNRRGMDYVVPDDYGLRSEKAVRIDESGRKHIKIGSVDWFTNLEHGVKHPPLDLYKHYTPEEYPKYDNYDAIEVGKTSEIPKDYDGVMGVPISFLHKYNEEQFKILGCSKTVPKDGLFIDGKEKFTRLFIKKNWVGRIDRPVLNGKTMYCRIFVENNKVCP